MKSYKRRFIEDETDPYVQKLNKKQKQINKISQQTLEKQREIIKELYELMPLKAKIKFHDKFGGDCLTDIYDKLE